MGPTATQPRSTQATATTLTAFDARPFFARALVHGVRQGVLDAARVKQIEADMAKGVVQIAQYFGTAWLRPELELALERMLRLMSLYLEDVCEGDLDRAAISLRDHSLLSHSKGGADKLKRLQALPETAVMLGDAVVPEHQRNFLDDKTAAHPYTWQEYRGELSAREAHRDTLEFAFWLARKMGAARDEVVDAEALIRSAMLVVFVSRAALQLPSRTAFVTLVEAARKPRARLSRARFDAFMADAEARFVVLAEAAMDVFLDSVLPRLREPDASADALLYGDTIQAFFVRENLEEAVSEYDKLVAREWHRVTRGESDDPQVIASVFLLLATGLKPKSGVLLKDGREIIRRYREQGFVASAVADFIEHNAPLALREELLGFWQNELRPEAEERLADRDPSWPDVYMERALAYLRSTCRASWKARRG